MKKIPGEIIPSSDKEMWELILSSVEPRGSDRRSCYFHFGSTMVFSHKFVCSAIRDLASRMRIAAAGLDTISDADKLLLHLLMCHAGLSIPEKLKKK